MPKDSRGFKNVSDGFKRRISGELDHNDPIPKTVTIFCGKTRQRASWNSTECAPTSPGRLPLAQAARSLFSTYLTIVPTVNNSGILETEGSLANFEKSACGMAALSRSKPDCVSRSPST